MPDPRYYSGEPGPEHDPSAGGYGIPYVCTVCDWHARGGIAALEHHVVTGHAVRGRSWPASWPNAVFGAERRKEQRTV